MESKNSSEYLRPYHTAKILNKPEGAVYIKPGISPLARIIWNILTSVASENMEHDQHCVSINELSQAIGYNSKNLTPIKQALVALVSTPIVYIKESNGILSHDPEWAVTCFLSESSISKGKVFYKYSTFLREQIQSQSIYVKINLNDQKHLTNSRAIYLYEIAVRYIKNESYPGLTPRWSIPHFRRLMAAESKTYDEFKFLNNKIIKPYLKIINKETNIKLTAIFHPKTKRNIGSVP